MAKKKVEDIRTVAFMGHGGTGKTTLVDEILYATGANTRIGSVKEGTSLSDTAEDEIENQASIDLSILHCNHKKKFFYLLDTPGRSDFIGQVYCAMRAVESVVLTIDAYSGIQVNTRKIWKLAKDDHKAIAIVLTKLDLENIEIETLIGKIQEFFGPSCVPFFLPDTTGSGISQLYSVLNPPDDAPELVKKYYEPLIESIVESDEELMMRYLDGEDVKKEIESQVSKAIANGDIVPILCYSQKNSLGVKEIMDTLASYFPSPADVKKVKVEIKETVTNEDGIEETKISYEERELKDDVFVGQIFKIIVDEHKGNMALIRVFSGEASSGSSFKNLNTGKSAKFGKLFRLFGAKHEEISDVSKGDIFAAAKLDDLHVSDTLVIGDWDAPIVPIQFPIPMVALAIKPKSRSDEGRISGVLTRYTTEDPTFKSEVDKQTKELVVYGMSDLHLNTLLQRMAKRHNVNVDTKLPKISYRETITKEVDCNYRHKKQSGGAGEFAEVYLRIRPYAAKDKDLNFINALRGDNVRRQFVPSVEKGCRSIIEQGILTGSPIVWVEVEFYDGKDHPVDGKDVAFQKAARECFRKGFLQANPVLLEPMVNLEISTPSDYAGEISQYVSSHRGKITGVDILGQEQVIRCTIPLAEVQNFSSDLRSMTQDQGSYSMEFAGYENVPPHVQKQVVEQYQKEQEEARA